MTSLDIDALFTNIPLYQTIDIWVKKLLKTQDTLAKGKSKNDIRDLLNFATKESFFLFNNNFYIQVDGLAIKSALKDTFFAIVDRMLLNPYLLYYKSPKKPREVSKLHDLLREKF